MTTNTPTHRSTPVGPEFDDAVSYQDAIDHIRTGGDYREWDEQSHHEVRFALTYDAHFLVSRIDQYANYRRCEKYNIDPPTVESYTPETDRAITHDAYGWGGVIEIPIKQRGAVPLEQLTHAQDGDAVIEQHRDRLYSSITDRILTALEEGVIDVPITRSVVEEVHAEGLTPSVADESEAADSAEFETKQREIIVGHKRLHVIGVQMGTETYWQTEREAVEAYYDRCERIQEGCMTAEDFRPYITEPPEHVRQYPETVRIPTFGEPVDHDELYEELNITSRSDLTDTERKALKTAIQEKWPEEALH